MKVKNAFKGIIGQINHILALSNMVEANEKVNMAIPGFIVTGERGAGKTKLMTSLIKAINPEHILPQCDIEAHLPTPNTIRGDNGSQVEYDSFVEHAIIALSSGKKTLFVFDEVHELGKGPKYNPLTFKYLAIFFMKAGILSKEGRKGMIKLGQTEILWDPSLHFIVIGTNFADKLDSALVSRFREVNLSAYTQEELLEIFKIKLEEKGFQANEDTVALMVRVCRTSAREIDTLVGEISSVIGAQGKKTINKQDVVTAMKQMEKYPFGFNKEFVRALQKLDSVVLTQPVIQSLFPSLKAIIGNELAIASHHDLVSRSTKGWSLTEKGKRALITWKKDGFSV